jgi:hypothetical protein
MISFTHETHILENGNKKKTVFSIPVVDLNLNITCGKIMHLINVTNPF